MKIDLGVNHYNYKGMLKINTLLSYSVSHSVQNNIYLEVYLFINVYVCV